LPTLIFVHGAWVRDAPWWSQMTEPDGTVGVHADLVRELFLQDCDEAGVQQALDRLTRQSATPFAHPPLHTAWQHKPPTYFLCTEDLAIPTELQRQRASPRARLIDFPSGHHPFLSQPEALVQSIAAERLDRLTRPTAPTRQAFSVLTETHQIPASHVYAAP
jgi:pimeloyl-ACP methyl ester carboxylesterase